MTLNPSLDRRLSHLLSEYPEPEQRGEFMLPSLLPKFDLIIRCILPNFFCTLVCIDTSGLSRGSLWASLPLRIFVWNRL